MHNVIHICYAMLYHHLFFFRKREKRKGGSVPTPVYIGCLLKISSGGGPMT